MPKPVITLEDLVTREARELAKAQIAAHLATQDLPLPTDSALEIHINNLLIADPSLRSRARDRVSAKTDAYTASLAAIGLTPEIATPVDVEIDL